MPWRGGGTDASRRYPPSAVRTDFVESVLRSLLEDDVLHQEDSILTVCAGAAEHELFVRLGLTNVVISNVDEPLAEDRFAPLSWSRRGCDEPLVRGRVVRLRVRRGRPPSHVGAAPGAARAVPGRETGHHRRRVARQPRDARRESARLRRRARGRGRDRQRVPERGSEQHRGPELRLPLDGGGVHQDGPLVQPDRSHTRSASSTRSTCRTRERSWREAG